MARWCHLPVGTLVSWEGSYAAPRGPFLVIEQHVDGRCPGVGLLQVVSAEVVVILPLADVENDQLVGVPLRVALDGAHWISDDLMHGKELTAHDDAMFQEQNRDHAGPHGGGCGHVGIVSAMRT